MAWPSFRVISAPCCGGVGFASGIAAQAAALFTLLAIGAVASVPRRRAA